MDDDPHKKEDVNTFKDIDILPFMRRIKVAMNMTGNCPQIGTVPSALLCDSHHF